MNGHAPRKVTVFLTLLPQWLLLRKPKNTRHEESINIRTSAEVSKTTKKPHITAAMPQVTSPSFAQPTILIMQLATLTSEFNDCGMSNVLNAGLAVTGKGPTGW